MMSTPTPEPAQIDMDILVKVLGVKPDYERRCEGWSVNYAGYNGHAWDDKESALKIFCKEFWKPSKRIEQAWLVVECMAHPRWGPASELFVLWMGKKRMWSLASADAAKAICEAALYVINEGPEPKC